MSSDENLSDEEVQEERRRLTSEIVQLMIVLGAIVYGVSFFFTRARSVDVWVDLPGGSVTINGHKIHGKGEYVPLDRRGNIAEVKIGGARHSLTFDYSGGEAYMSVSGSPPYIRGDQIENVREADR